MCILSSRMVACIFIPIAVTTARTIVYAALAEYESGN